MVGKQGRQRATKEDALTDAAARHLAHSPGASMDEIAQAAAVSRATLFRRHPSRAQLVAELSERAVRAYIAAVGAAEPEEGGVTEALTRLVEHLAPLAPTYGLLALQPMEPSVEETLLAEAQGCDDRLRQLIRRGQRDGTFTLELSPGWMLTAITWLIVGAADSLRQGSLAPTDLKPYLTTTIVSAALRR